MKINNAFLLSLLFRDFPEFAEQIANTTAYVAVINGNPCLIIHCRDLLTTTLMLNSGQIIATRLKSVLGFDFCLECGEDAVGEANMIAVADRVENSTTSNENRLFNLEILAKATHSTTQEVKLLLAKSRSPIYPQLDGSEAIEEVIFDTVLSDWAKSLKAEGSGSTVQEAEGQAQKSETRTRKATPKVLTSELVADDIVKVKSGKSAGSPNLTQKGIEQTLKSFFGKVKLDDTTEVDAVSAFIEGTSEFGTALRKKILAAYKKFATKPNMEEVEARLIDGAKAHLEAMTATANEQ
ncbi:hypothetical protein [Nostoc sp. FACHB-110]|uniref:hypothetical protein n=1 Tax=Nostoc sp. FACHB-110 TaxID=2692834 RepID=UPI001682BA60|nr:hypothetical protein [Nostoc sp. FACHB-110]MBD2437346.1 hypothetical protein [Nostoc sp. FACHB-110]